MNPIPRRHFFNRMIAVSGATLFSAEIQRALAASPSQDLHPEHPRLLLRKADWDALSRDRAAGLIPEELVTGIHRSAEKVLKLEPSERVMEGRRLLGVSREVARRVVHLAFAHRTGGPEGCARRAIQEMMAAAAFTDWNPSHFLDVAEMTAALAVGYDWLGDEMSKSERQTVAGAILTKGLQPALDLARRNKGFPRMHNNWNQVCWGGILLGALAIGDEQPDIMRELLAKARETMSAGLAPLEPDGVYPEGPGYWSYGSMYQVLTIEALRTALGDDGGVARNPAWLASADFYLHASGPDGAYYNFADCGNGRAGSPVMVWMAREKKNAGYLFHEKRNLAAAKDGKAKHGIWDPLIARWWPSAAAMQSKPLPLHWHGLGENPVAFWRSSWEAPGAVYLAIKAGGAPVSHGHMDAGSFVFEAMGVRWAHELSPESYHRVESMGVVLWDFKQDSDRWKLFRLNNNGHNTLVVGGQAHRSDQLAKLLRSGGAGALIDFSGVLGPSCKRAFREVEWSEKSVVIEDVVLTKAPGTEVRWTMNTRAEATVEGRRVVLRENGKTLYLDFKLPEVGSVDVLSIERPDGKWDSPNPGFRQIRVVCTSPETAECRIRATFSGW
jgi:oligo-alginate lyase